jgi:hypothetical protein
MWQKLRVVLTGALVAGPIAALAMSLACTNSSPTTSTPTTTLQACLVDNTAKITFENRSTSNKTYDIVWDGSRIATLSPTQKSDTYTEAAGVTHSLQFKVTNSSQVACSTSHPVLVVCSAQNYWCTY